MRLQPWMRVSLALFVVGWGANEFAPLLIVYRRTDHLSETLVTAMFAAYVLGLVPALIVAARLAGRFGHRAVMRPVMVTAGLSSLLLAVGESSPPLLFAGRVLYGVCTGAAMAPGTTWVKELSAGAPTGTGARRAAMSLSAGFGGGPLVTGFLAQWLPAPKVLPYLVHIGLTIVAGALVWRAPQTATVEEEHVVSSGEPSVVPAAPVRGSRHTALRGHFWSRVAPMAPWVFTCATVGLVILPSLMQTSIAGFAVAFTGIMAGITLGVGVVVQQPARGIEAAHPGLVSVLGMACAVAGVLLTVVVVDHRSVPLVIVAGVVLGCGYGMTLVGGLTRIEHLTPASDLAMTNAVFYSLTYLGFFVPTIVSMLVERWPEQWVLLGLAGLGVLSLAAAALAQRAARPAPTRAAELVE
ncbi:MFS transporter [Flexivirga sp. ID2601S]|uniref:MFS transporter n=1 Tax=Flexivirga aerilata TaxID=1656889 RepID=A0A849AEF1_9MICO|nr:MFS transporter [Flexivirga aerilata]NNG38183.1 MFS transporter [Flexivirga aerilata]